MSWTKELFWIEKPEAPTHWQRAGAATVITLVSVAKLIWSKNQSSTILFIPALVWMLWIFFPRQWGRALQFGLWAFLTVFHWLSLVALSFVFILTFSLLGTWKRRRGWDPMRSRFEPSATSYREEPEKLTMGHFTKPF